MKKMTFGLLVAALMVMPMTAMADDTSTFSMDKFKSAANSSMDKVKSATDDSMNKIKTIAEGPKDMPANYGSLKLGYFMPNNDDEGLKDFKKTWDVELAYGRMFTKNIAGEIGATYFTSKYDKDDGDAKVKSWSIPVTAKYIYPINKDIDVFAGAGFGYYSAKLEVGDESDTGTGWGYHGVVGCDYKIDTNMAVGMEVKYNQAKVKNSDWDDKLNVGGTSVKLCAKYKF